MTLPSEPNLAEMWDRRWERIRQAVPDLPDGASLNSHRCGTCTRCQRQYGMVPIFDPRFDRERDGAYHYDLEFDGTPAVFGGKVARATGRTDDEAFDNLIRALS